MPSRAAAEAMTEAIDAGVGVVLTKDAVRGAVRAGLSRFGYRLQRLEPEGLERERLSVLRPLPDFQALEQRLRDEISRSRAEVQQRVSGRSSAPAAF